MTKIKNTKRALLMSALSLLLCVSMLVGSTFAWFTDSVTSANNIIKSGNLDIELEYWNGTEWKDVKGASDILTNTLWEPGVTEVTYLRVANAGSLVLKYQLGINILNEITGKNQAGEIFKLSDYIQFGVVENVNGQTGAYSKDDAGRAAAIAAVTDSKKISAGYTKAATMNPDAELYLALVVYMPTNVGNVANHNGTDVPQIDLGINVYATQMTSEFDSFDNQYDDIVLVSDAAALEDALAAGKNVMLTSDIDVALGNNTDTITVPADTSVLLDLNGYDISTVSATSGANLKTFTVKGEMTVIGEGTVSFVQKGDNMGWSNLTAAFSIEGGELTLGEGVVVVNGGGSDMAYAVDVNSTLGETVLNVNGATLLSTYTGVRLFNNSQSAKAIVNYNSGLIIGENRDIWNQSPSASAVVNNAVVNIASDFTYTTEPTSNGGCKYFFADDVTLVGDAAALAAALANGGNIVLLADIEMNDANTVFTVANGTNVTLDLNGHDIIAKSTSTASVELFFVDGVLEIVGNGTVSLTGDNFPWNSSYRYTAINIRENGEVTLGEGVNVVCEASKDGSNGMSYAVDIYTTGTLNVDGASLHSNYIAVRCFFGASVVNVTSGSITSSKNNWGIWPQSAAGAVITIASGIDYTTDAYGIYIFG